MKRAVLLLLAGLVGLSGLSGPHGATAATAVTQTTTIAVAASVPIGATIKMRVGSRPIRAGRALGVERWMSGKWMLVARGPATSGGFVDLTVTAPAVAGVVQYRPVSLAYPSLAKHNGAVVKVTVTASTWRDLSTSCGVKTNGVAQCWGRYRGDGTIPASATAYQLPGLWKSLSSSGMITAPNANTTCGIRSDSTAWCWGDNDEGQVGNGTTTDQPTPTQLPGYWRELETRSGTTCGIRINDSGWCWGRNRNGQVGNGSDIPPVTRPAQLLGEWRSFETFGQAPCAFQVDGSAWCWGVNEFNGFTGGGWLQPVHVSGDWLSFSSDDVTTCAVRADHTGWCWGANTAGEVSAEATPTVPDHTSAHQIPGLWNTLETSGQTTCGVRTNGVGQCWGFNGQGQLGNGRTSASGAVQLPGAWRWIRPMEQTVCGLRADGTLHCWGNNASGRVGNGGVGPQYTPFRVPISVKSIDRQPARGTCAVGTNGTGWCWGDWLGQRPGATAAQLGTPTQLR